MCKKSLSARTPSSATTVLEARIRDFIARTQLECAHYGILFQPPSEWGDQSIELLPEPAVSINAHACFVPASNAKICTAAAALIELGQEYTFKTELLCDFLQGGNIWVRGEGDPSFSTVDMFRLASAAVAAGVQGPVKLSIHPATYERAKRGAEGCDPTWMLEDADRSYGACPGVLNLEGNIATVTATAEGEEGDPLDVVWPNDDWGYVTRWQREVKIRMLAVVAPKKSRAKPTLCYCRRSGGYELRGELAKGSAETIHVPVTSPMGWFIENLAISLEMAGVQCSHTSKTPFPSYEDPVVIVEQESRGLGRMLGHMLHKSDNLYAECILHAAAAPRGIHDRQQAAKHAMKVLSDRGLADSWHLWDGSGLSRRNLLSPAVMVQLLSLAARQHDLEPLFASLPSAGVGYRGEGTLAGRLSECPYMVIAKTGTMHGITTLSGYISVDESLCPGVFSIMVNSALGSTSKLRATVDELVVMLAESLDQPAMLEPLDLDEYAELQLQLARDRFNRTGKRRRITRKTRVDSTSLHSTLLSIGSFVLLAVFGIHIHRQRTQQLQYSAPAR